MWVFSNFRINVLGVIRGAFTTDPKSGPPWIQFDTRILRDLLLFLSVCPVPSICLFRLVKYLYFTYLNSLIDFKLEGLLILN